MSDETDRPASRIIDAFGGIRPMAARLNVPVSTVQGWKQRDTVPAGRMEAVRAAARDAGIDLESAQPGATAPADQTDSCSHGDLAETLETPTEASVSSSGDRSPAPSRGGGVAVLALLVALSVGGWVWWSTMGPGVSGGDNARLSALEGRVARLAEATGDNAPVGDPTALAALTRDVASLRSQISDLSPSDLEAMLAPMQAEIGGLRDALAAQGASDRGAAPVDAATLTRLEAIEREIQNIDQLASTNKQVMSGGILESDAKLQALTVAQAALESRVAALEAGRSADEAATFRASALALAAGQLRTALERGVPFADTLELAGSLGADNPALRGPLATLRTMAETGVATGVVLEVAFAALVPELLSAGEVDESEDLVDRLAGRINDIVRIRRTGADVRGDGVEARIARAEVMLADRDISAAVGALEGLEGPAGDILKPWMVRARGHLQAQDAVTAIETHAIDLLRTEGGS